MVQVHRKGENEMRQVEIFRIVMEDGDQEAMRADPEQFVRQAVASEIPTVNRMSVDVDLLNDLANDEPMATWVVHHTVSGSEESAIDVTREM
ncbi:hypothetical protein [Streptomyces sp. B6B3]|jgi:3-methyladenine DNA glycosylase AlkC|uniref:hypothetical protein n=1 Tax=Streptomyces sp. B6B3 TaxID=3153570 RepID=UPI00325C8C8A